MALPGVYSAIKKDGSTYYRASLTYSEKHISLGSFSSEIQAHHAYLSACSILSDSKREAFLPDYVTYQNSNCILTFSKWIMLLNLRDHNIYCKNPIYLQKNYFLYYIDKDTILKFDKDDLFYYMQHKIMKRGGHLFVSDYGMQVNLLSRYGIHNFSVCGRDYRFVNGDCFDFRYHNILVINHYYGVFYSEKKGLPVYTAKININGSVIIGTYSTEIQAAIAYNKAVQYIKQKGCKKQFFTNYIDSIDPITYAKTFHEVKLSSRIRQYTI